MTDWEAGVWVLIAALSPTHWVTWGYLLTLRSLIWTPLTCLTRVLRVWEIEHWQWA